MCTYIGSHCTASRWWKTWRETCGDLGLSITPLLSPPHFRPVTAQVYPSSGDSTGRRVRAYCIRRSAARKKVALFCPKQICCHRIGYQSVKLPFQDKQACNLWRAFQGAINVFKEIAPPLNQFVETGWPPAKRLARGYGWCSYLYHNYRLIMVANHRSITESSR